jgi:hypothetical protein
MLACFLRFCSSWANPCFGAHEWWGGGNYCIEISLHNHIAVIPFPRHKYDSFATTDRIILTETEPTEPCM